MSGKHKENSNNTIFAQIFTKIIICSLSVLCSPRLILTRSPQISGQNKSEAREPEGLVKITYGMMLAPFLKEWEIQIRKKI